MKNVSLYALTVIILLCMPTVIQASIKISRIDPHTVKAGGKATLKLSGVDAASTALQVVADYGDHFLYALEILQQTAHSVTVRVPDLGRHLKIKLQVKLGAQTSNTKSITLKPLIQTRRNPPPKKHRLLVGDKGEDRFKVNNKSASCGQPGEVFDHASIRFLKKRFAEAQFVALPEPGCSQCKDIRVRWYNEPTGELVYQLQIFRRQIEGACRKKVL